jgi:carbon storage regulator
MLVLTRGPGEEICIGDEITIVVLQKRGRQVRIGVTAPNGMRVDRAEIRGRIKDGIPKPAQSDSTR